MADAQNEIVVQANGEKVRKYKPFEGKSIDKMPELLAEGRMLITPKQLETARLSGFEADRQYLRGVYVSVDVAVIPNPHGKEVKYVYGHPLILTLNPNSGLTNHGALPVSQEHYDDYEGFVLSKSEVKEFRNNNHALPNRRREFWEFLAEGNVKLARAYEKDVCDTLGSRFDNAMGIWMPKTKGLHLLCIGSVANYNKSVADGNNLFGNYCLGRLVGVAQGKKPKGIEQVLAI